MPDILLETDWGYFYQCDNGNVRIIVCAKTMSESGVKNEIDIAVEVTLSSARR